MVSITFTHDRVIGKTICELLIVDNNFLIQDVSIRRSLSVETEHNL